MKTYAISDNANIAEIISIGGKTTNHIHITDKPHVNKTEPLATQKPFNSIINLNQLIIMPLVSNCYSLTLPLLLCVSLLPGHSLNKNSHQRAQDVRCHSTSKSVTYVDYFEAGILVTD
jgi:hypothetical protein